MRALSAIIVLTLLMGCQKASTPDTTVSSNPAPQPAATSPTPTPSGGGGVAPIGSGAAGGMTPMTGTESVEGAGMGGIGQVAKDKARGAAGMAGSTSTPPEDGQ